MEYTTGKLELKQSASTTYIISNGKSIDFCQMSSGIRRVNEANAERIVLTWNAYEKMLHIIKQRGQTLFLLKQAGQLSKAEAEEFKPIQELLTAIKNK